MAAGTILSIKEAKVQFAATAVAVAAAPDWTCQVTSAAINTNPNLQTVPATFCAGESQAPGASGYELVLTWLQDWGATDSMSQFMWDNDASLQFFEITPVDPAAPAASGQCWVTAGAYLGDAGTPLTATATCPCPVKPTITGGATLAAEAGDVEAVA